MWNVTKTENYLFCVHTSSLELPFYPNPIAVCPKTCVHNYDQHHHNSLGEYSTQPALYHGKVEAASTRELFFLSFEHKKAFYRLRDERGICSDVLEPWDSFYITQVTPWYWPHHVSRAHIHCRTMNIAYLKWTPYFRYMYNSLVSSTLRVWTLNLMTRGTAQSSEIKSSNFYVRC